MENFIHIGKERYAKVQEKKGHKCAFYQGKCNSDGFIFKKIRQDANVKLKFMVPDNNFKIQYLVFDREDCLKRFSLKGLTEKSSGKPTGLDSFQVNRGVILLVAGKKVYVEPHSHIIVTDCSMYSLSDKVFKELYERNLERNFRPIYGGVSND